MYVNPVSREMNFKLLIQYDGTDFHGWQMQGELRTVQGELTAALSQIDSRPVIVHGSGRTDAGVHAEGQVASVSLLKEINADKLRAAINGNVGRDVRVMEAQIVPDDFHARYSAVGKTYVYRIVNGRVISPLWLRYAHHEGRPLDLGRMNDCAKLFLGTHDWTAFSSAQADAETRTRTITHFSVAKREDDRARCEVIEIKVSANGFLRYMVRSIAGTLLAVGRREIDNDVVQRAIDGGDRALAGATAPACGLTLLSVAY
ncbi:MAG TPA: tRNA pseudouridine(38-40) synthase TruA [Pyrinomonadaceae bacterium]|nr:tRNA pseudouridine(38-40) synthase TruA [Pyrinomonadaceae bacterium]